MILLHFICKRFLKNLYTKQYLYKYLLHVFFSNKYYFFIEHIFIVIRFLHVLFYIERIFIIDIPHVAYMISYTVCCVCDIL
jgi:hypothetical protein